MTLRRLTVKKQPCLWALLVLAGMSSCQPSTADSDLENARLAALVRQLDLLDRLAADSSTASDAATRYHFDYARLRLDLARIRTGIEEYLSPRRAQPRDPQMLSGEYTREAVATP